LNVSTRSILSYSDIPLFIPFSDSPFLFNRFMILDIACSNYPAMATSFSAEEPENVAAVAVAVAVGGSRELRHSPHSDFFR
jgi:hypothetical protein